ncbi:hypothetical protein HPG69_009905, partial [Diceros bicornis minor]
PQRICHHELIQLHLRVPASSEEEGSGHIPSPAAPEVLKETSVLSQRKSQHGKDAGATTGQKQTWRNTPPRPDSSRPQKHKIPLLPHRQGDLLRLPAPRVGAPLPSLILVPVPPTSLLITPALSSSPSTSTSAGLAPQPASDTKVTLMDTTPPPQPLLSGSPLGSSGSLFPSAQVLQTPPSDSMASVTITCLHRGSAAPRQL